MTIAERVELYKKLHKNCKAVEPVAKIRAKGYQSKTPLGRLDLLRECVSDLVSKDGYNCLCPTITCWERDNNYVKGTYEIYLTEPDLEGFLHQFRHHLQNLARDPEKEDLLYEGNEGITKKVLFSSKETNYTLYGEDDAIAWSEMVLEAVKKFENK